MKQVKLIVSGKVQGVCFRHYTKEKALNLNVRGWVRNLYNGDVEILAEGDPCDVDALVNWAHKGPSSAIVKNVKIEEHESNGELDVFRVRYER